MKWNEKFRTCNQIMETFNKLLFVDIGGLLKICQVKDRVLEYEDIERIAVVDREGKHKNNQIKKNQIVDIESEVNDRKDACVGEDDRADNRSGLCSGYNNADNYFNSYSIFLAFINAYSNLKEKLNAEHNGYSSSISSSSRNKRKDDDLHDKLGRSSRSYSTTNVSHINENDLDLNEVKKVSSNSSYSLILALTKTIGYGIIVESIICYIVSIGCTYAPVIIVNRIIQILQSCFNPINDEGTACDANEITPQLWTLVFFLIIFPFLGALASSRNIILLSKAAAVSRTALSSALYAKTLKLSSPARGLATTGQILNLISNDSNRLLGFFPMIHGVWGIPLLVTVGLFLFYEQVGVAVFPAIVVLMIILPMGYVGGKLIKFYQQANLENTDERIKWISQTLHGIRSVKMYAWEEVFEKKIESIRAKELRYLKKIAIAAACTINLIMVGNMVPFVIILISNLHHVCFVF